MKVLQYGECFRALGAPISNPRAWSSINANTLVLALFEDGFILEGGHARYCSFGYPDTRWQKKARNFDRIEHLKYAKTHCNGVFSAFLTKAIGVETHNEVAACLYVQNLKLKLNRFDETTGEIDATVLSPDQKTFHSAIGKLRR